MKITQRDNEVLSTLLYTVLSLFHLATLFFCGNKKKAAERMKMLFDAGLVFRAQKPFVGGRGKAEYVYSVKPIKNVYSIPHSLIIGDLHVAMFKSENSDYSVNYSYPVCLGLTYEGLNGLIPDAVAIIERVTTGKRLVHFIEADTGSESISTRRAHYSVEKKFDRYVSLYDEKTALSSLSRIINFDVKGFRVLVVASSRRRIRGLKELTRNMGAEFFWFASNDDICIGNVFGSIWSNYKYNNLSLIGRYPPRDQIGE